MKHKARHVFRTIRHGRVKVRGRWFAPSEQWQQYRGELDGLRYAFGVYWTGDRMEPYVSLCGIAENYEKGYRWMRGPEVQDGCLPWLWWNEIDYTPGRRQ